MIFKNIFTKSVYVLFLKTGNHFINFLIVRTYQKLLRFFLDYTQFLNTPELMNSLILVSLVKGLWYTI
ncbi:hypothetical protein EDF66_12141 [Sphingobacterium sp. JUb20]|nr:hypothetical protein [Sphingobacterium sp. JUb21]TCQ96699.1 hypothetical protein EDF66_12141 [Sphingobacterium sp. JUb20]